MDRNRLTGWVGETSLGEDSKEVLSGRSSCICCPKGQMSRVGWGARAERLMPSIKRPVCDRCADIPIWQFRAQPDMRLQHKDQTRSGLRSHIAYGDAAGAVQATAS
jgi:hypothetical protein